MTLRRRMEEHSYCDMTSLRGAEPLYVRGRPYSSALYVGPDRAAAPRMGSCRIKFRRGYDSGFDAKVDCALGSVLVACERVREGLFRWFRGSSYSGSLLVDGEPAASVEVWSSVTSDPFCCVAFGDDRVSAHRVDAGRDTAVHVVAESTGLLAVVDYGGPELTVRELRESRFGFGRLPFGSWECDGKLLGDRGAVMVHAVLVAMFLPHYIVDFSSTTGGS